MSKPVVAQPGSALDVELAVRLDQILTKLVRWSRREVAAPMGPGMLSALASVVDAGSIRLGDLAAREQVSAATLSRLAAALEREGYLLREVDRADRRSAFVRPTPAGVALVRDLRARRGAVLLQRLQPALGAGEVASLRALVERLEGAFAEQSASVRH